MTAGNRWPVSHPSTLPSSSNAHDQGSENNHTSSAARADPLSGTAVESVVGSVISSQRPHLPPPPTSNTTAATPNRSAQDTRNLAPLSNHHSTNNTFPYPLFPERQLPAFDLRQIGDVHRGPLPSIASHTRLGAGVSSSSDPRSPFGMEEPSSSSSTNPPHRNPSVTVDAYEQHQYRPPHGSQQPSSQPYPHPRSLHSVHPSYRTPGYSHDTFHPENILSRPSSSHDTNHLGISSLLHSGGSNRDRERSGLGVPETRRDNHSSLLNAPRSPGDNPAMVRSASMMYESELKRKRYMDEQSSDSMRRTRLPSLPGLSIAGTLPPPPGFNSSHRGASPSPLPSPSHSHYQRDGPRTGYRLIGDDGGETDQLDMDVDGVEGADGYQQGGDGKNKEDARKEKNRDKQRRLRMRRANQLQTLENTVGTQESDIKRLSQQVHESDERLRHVNIVFFDWIEVLEKRLRELGEPDNAIMSVREQHLLSLNTSSHTSSRESQRDSIYRESSKSTSSGHRLQQVKGETTTDGLAPYNFGLGSRQPQRTDGPVATRIPYESRSPVAIPSYRGGNHDRDSSPSYVQQRREQIDPHYAQYTSMTGRDPPPVTEPMLLSADDSWRTSDRSDIYQAARPSSHSVDLDRKDGHGIDPRFSDGHRSVLNDSSLEQEILARLEDEEVFDMPEAQVTQLASTLARQKQTTSLHNHRDLPDGDGTDHLQDGRTNSKTPFPWRDRYTSAQVLLLYRSLGILTRDNLESRDRQIKRRSDLLSPLEQESWERWVRTPDKDKRIDLLQDPVLQMYFISPERSPNAIESELIPFLCDQLHEARLFGPAWFIHCWEMVRSTWHISHGMQLTSSQQANSFLDRWAKLWPQHLATASLADWRRRDGHTGASPLDIVKGVDSRSTLKRGNDLESLP